MVITTKHGDNSYFASAREGCVKVNFVTKGRNNLHLPELASAEIFTDETTAERDGIPAKKYYYARDTGKLRALSRYGSGRNVRAEERAIMALVEKALTVTMEYAPDGCKTYTI